jgi:tetratricopeptide (TPR) repeat protein
MTKRIALFLLLAMMATFTVTAAAQVAGVVRGTCKDEEGKPLVGITVELNNQDNGRKTILKTDKSGNYYSMGMIAGTYKINFLAPDGKVIYYLNNAPIKAGGESTYDVDLAKAKAEAAKDSGISEAQRKEYEKAKKENEKIKGVNALLLQGSAQKKEGKYDEAVTTLEQAVAQDQTHDIVYGSLADAYLLDKKYPEAEATFLKAIELAPPTSKSVGGYHNSLAQALLKQGKTEQAMAEYDKAAQLDPANGGMYYFNEGAVLTNQGKVEEANVAFDKAIAADPTRADAYYQKGLNLLGKATLGKDGKMIPAPGTVEALNKYLELAPDGRYAQPAKDLLASLGASVQTSFGTDKRKATKK